MTRTPPRTPTLNRGQLALGPVELSSGNLRRAAGPRFVEEGRQ